MQWFSYFASGPGKYNNYAKTEHKTAQGVGYMSQNLKRSCGTCLK